MKFIFHNKLEINIGEKILTFFNTMLSSTLTKLSNLESFGNFVSVGSGIASSSQDEFHLTNFIASFNLSNEILQNDISKSPIYVKKTVTISDKNLNGKYLTEIGLSDGNSENPEIYNYFSLVSDDYPKGILKEPGKQISLSIYIYLEIDEGETFLLTSGSNEFISFLLGEGLNGTIYAKRGYNLTENKRISRETPSGDEKFECEVSLTTTDDELSIDFQADIGTGDVYEIVFLIDDTPFARQNLQDYKSARQCQDTLTPTTNYIIDLGENVKSFSTVINVGTADQEDYDTLYKSNYATDFADKITLPFNNIFDNSTPRFLSKDGDKIFFVLNDELYAYQNSDLCISQIGTGNVNVQNISKVISFENYVFVLSKVEPYIHAFLISNENLVKVLLDFSSFELYSSLGDLFASDITMSNDGTFMFGFILNSNHYAYTIYFNFDETTNEFEYDTFLSSERYFSYILAMYKNNFTDSTIMFLVSGEISSTCRLVEFSPGKEVVDEYTIMAYRFASTETKELYTKNRAVIVEKTTSPYLYIYYYPQYYVISFDEFNEGEDYFISTNLLYLIQKNSSGEYKIYNLVGYDELNEFTNGFPSEVDQNKILNFEFLDDTLLIFMDSESEPIVAYNLKETGTIIENVSTNEDEYEIAYSKYNLLGSSNENVKVTLSLKVTI